METEQTEMQKPKVLEINIHGTVSKISAHYTEEKDHSDPYGGRYEKKEKTKLVIRQDDGTIERIVFNAYVGFEIVGERVSFYEKITRNTEYFQDSRGKSSEGILQRLVSQNRDLPVYLYSKVKSWPI